VRSWWPKGLALYLIKRPLCVVTLLRAAWPLRRDGWWRHRPLLPVPDARYWHFRMVTANGESSDAFTPDAVLDAARWSVRQRAGKEVSLNGESVTPECHL